ncbi:MAG: serine protease [Planctomycetota bacterium]
MIRWCAFAFVLQLTAALAAAPRAAVCRIAVAEAGGQAFGSGTLIDARDDYGLVVTNWHVVRDATGPITVIFPDGFRSKARTVKLDETWDLAALVIWRPKTEPVALAARPPRPGEALTICGWGQGDYREAGGRCTDYYAPEMGKPMELVELSVQARQGDSGGPILNDRGELAGVLFGAGQGVTLGSYGGRVRGFLATLAPDIGVPNGGLPAIAATPAAPPARSKAVDPFVAATRRAQASTSPPAGHAANVVATPTTPIQPMRPEHDWRSVPYAAWEVTAKRSNDGPTTPALAAPFPPAPMAPALSASALSALVPSSRAGTPISAAPSLTGEAPRQALDWDAEQSTLLAVLGVSAVAVLLGRAFG